MTVDLDRLEREHPGFLLSNGGRWHLFMGSSPTDTCYVAARLTGARFDDTQLEGCVMLPWPGYDDEHRGAAEALIAQWEGLAPIVVVEEPGWVERWSKVIEETC